MNDAKEEGKVLQVCAVCLENEMKDLRDKKECFFMPLYQKREFTGEKT